MQLPQEEELSLLNVWDDLQLIGLLVDGQLLSIESHCSTQGQRQRPDHVIRHLSASSGRTYVVRASVDMQKVKQVERCASD